MEYQLIIDDIIGSWGFSKQYVRSALATYKKKPVNVKITSLGGSLDDGLDIRQQFVDHGDVTVYLSGFVASAATVCAMGAKKICMGKYAMFLVHKCSNFLDAWGTYNADEIQTLIDTLTANKQENDKIDVVLANMYADKCKKKVNEILAILKDGKWLTAQEALDYGFIDEIVEDDIKINFGATMKSKFNRIGLPCDGLIDESSLSSPIIQIIQNGFNEIKTIFNHKVNNVSDIDNQNNTSYMTGKFLKLVALLNIESFAQNKNNLVELTSDQLQAINDRLDALENDVANRDTTITERDKTILDLNTQIQNLGGADGDITGNVIGGVNNADDTSAYSTSVNMFNSIKHLL
ncbi:MAG: Clp protease ClpP [Muribaculaceae bacterium]